MHWIIDTDAGVDDAIAIVLPFVPARYLDFTLAAITTVTGNVHVGKVNTNVGALLDLLDANTPFFAGCDRPLIEPHVHAEDFHGSDGLGDVGLSHTQRKSQAEHAALAISRLSKQHEADGFGIIALGPLTNLALAVNLDPTLPKRVQQLVIMGGAWQARGNQSSAAEFNIAIDPESARIVFERFENIVVLPWEVSLDQGMPFDRLLKIADGTLARSRFLKRLTTIMLIWQAKYHFASLPLPDPLAVMIALDNRVIAKQIACRVKIDIGHDSGRALSSLDMRHPQPNARVVTEVNTALAWDMLEAAWKI